MTTPTTPAGIPGGYCRRIAGFPNREACDCPSRYPGFCAAGITDNQPPNDTPPALNCHPEQTGAPSKASDDCFANTPTDWQEHSVLPPAVTEPNLYQRVARICEQSALPITALAVANVVDESDGTLDGAIIRLLFRIPVPNGKTITV